MTLPTRRFTLTVAALLLAGAGHAAPEQREGVDVGKNSAFTKLAPAEDEAGQRE